MTRRISIAGVDGSGKTTLIRKVREARLGDGILRAFRAPQYHEDPDSPFARLSKTVDDLSVLGDVRKDPILKATALFISMTFYGDVERHYETVFKPRFLLVERQALADSLTYSAFYKALLTREIDRSFMPENSEAILDWMTVLKLRCPRFFGHVDFWNLPLAIRDLFSLSAPDLVRELQLIYQTRIPDQIILLEVSAHRLQERLLQKRGDGTPEELHEKSETLGKIQEGLVKSCAFLKQLQPRMKLDRLDTSELSPEESLKRILSIIEN